MKKWNPTLQRYFDYYKPGDKVIIKNYHRQLNYLVGRIKRIDGGYFYVSVNGREVELYHCELVPYEKVYRYEIL